MTCHARDAKLISAGSLDWNTPAKWQDGYVPLSADDVVSLTVEGAESKTTYLSMPSVSFEIDSIVDANVDTYMMFARAAAPTRMSIRQMSGYNSRWPIGFRPKSLWATDNFLRSGLNLTGTASDPTEVNAYYLGTLPEFGVPDASGCGWIHRLMNTGMFVKDGVGKLVVDGPVGLTSGACVSGGTLMLSGDGVPDDPQPATGAFLHVDASRAGTLQTVQEGGAVCVTNWLDVSGSGNRAYFEDYSSGGTSLAKPRIAAKTANGRTLVDFGKYAQFSTGFDPDAPASWLVWSSGSTAIREVFFVAQLQDETTICNSSNAATPAPLGYGSSNINLTMKCDDQTLFTESDTYGADVRINGEPVTATGTYSPHGKLRVVSVAFPADIGRANAFGRRGYVSAGGFLLGEAIVYTNALTEAERRRTIAYLKRRWLDAADLPAERADFDLGEVAVRSSAAVAVADGKEARVKHLHDVDGVGLVKAGEGTLGVESIQPADAALTVESGKVKFTADAGNVTVPNSLPSDQAFHFDATDDDSFDYASGNLVTRWRDTSGAGLVATNIFCSTGVTDCPVRTDSASPTGLKAVDFVTAGIGTAYKTAPRMAFALTYVREGFIVWKNVCPDATKYAPTHFACICNESGKGQDCFAQREPGMLLNQTFARYLPASGGAVWTVNGKPVNPLDSSFGDIGGEDGFVVIHFTSAHPLPVNAMAAQHIYDFGGGCMIGELVGYERLLTDAERRGAEAYLMNRWLGEPHPDAETWRGNLTFAANATAEIATDRDLAPASVRLPGNTLRKSGTGSVSIPDLPTNVTFLAVDAGSLSASVAGFDDFADAFVHFDASDTNSFEMTANGDGTYSVTKWYDVRRNGIWADADTAMCRALPQFRSTAETGLTADAVGYVDFGPISICGKSPYSATNDLSSAMTWNVASTNVHEVHVVYADNVPFVDNGSVTCPVSYYNGNRAATCLSGIDRAYSEVFVYKNKSDGCCICDVNYNGETKDMHGKKPAGFGVVSLVVTGVYEKAGNTRQGAYLNTFANSRRTQYGGCRIAEVVVYDTALSSDRRRAVDAYLMKKWCGLGAGGTWLPGPAVTVAAGATATLADAAHVDLPSLSVAIDSSGVSGTLKVAGVFHAPKTFALTVNLASARHLRGKTFTLIDADAIADAENVSGWSVNVVGGGNLDWRLSADKNGDIVLSFDRRGMLLIVQ